MNLSESELESLRKQRHRANEQLGADPRALQSKGPKHNLKGRKRTESKLYMVFGRYVLPPLPNQSSPSLTVSGHLFDRTWLLTPWLLGAPVLPVTTKGGEPG